MLHRTVWDAPSASSKKKSVLNQVGFVTSNCMGRAVRQFEKEACLSLGTGVEYVALNCMGYAVHQFEKRSQF